MKTSPMNAERSFHKHHACRLPMRHARYAFVVMPINPGKFGKQCNTVPKRVITDTILKLSSWPAGENIQCSEEDFWIDRVDEMSIRCLTVSITTSIHNLEYCV